MRIWGNMQNMQQADTCTAKCAAGHGANSNTLGTRETAQGYFECCYLG